LILKLKKVILRLSASLQLESCAESVRLNDGLDLEILEVAVAGVHNQIVDCH